MIHVAEKCVFLDSDTILLQNADELFQLEGNPNFTAVQTCICNPAKNLSYPSFWTSKNRQHTYEDPSHLDEQRRLFNSEMFLFHPNKEVSKKC